MGASVLSHIRLFVTLWTVTHHAPLSTGFPRQEYWSVLTVLTQGDLPNLGIKLSSFVILTLADRFFTTASAGKPMLLLLLLSRFSRVQLCVTP